MKNFFMKCLAIYCLCLGTSLFAGPRSLNVMVNSFEKGYVLKQDALLTNAAHGKDFEETLKNQKEFYLERIKELSALQDHRIRAQFQHMPEDTSDDESGAEGDAEVKAIDLVSLKRCLDIVLPLMNKVMSLQLSTSSEEELGFLKQQLDFFRVQGKQSYLCGEYYDAKDIVLMGELDQWKLLLALRENLSNEERVVALIDALKAGYHLLSPVESRPLWQLITHLRVFQLAFGHELDEQEDLINTLQADLVKREMEINDGVISLKSADVRELFVLGQKFARGLNHAE